VPPQGYSPQGAPAYPEPPQQPKKKKTWLVVLIIAIVLLVLCCGLAIAGAFLYMPKIIENGLSDTTGDLTWEDSNSDSDSDDNTKPKAAEATDEVIVDDEMLTVIVKVGSGEEDEYLESYSVACTVENKTGEAFGLYFDDTTEAEGFFERAPMALIYPTGYVEDYPAYETTDATIVFLDTLLDEKVTNFKGVLVVYDLDTWETIAEYPFNIKEL
jgi:flagellar basal body-associated protein FliL